jgi:uncharacterized membrane protein (TIGR01218 family)
MLRSPLKRQLETGTAHLIHFLGKFKLAGFGKGDYLMNCEVQHLDKNIRYRMLIISGEHYILDMERSFWKVIFPFFFWMFPSLVFKVEDQNVIEQLKGPKIGNADKSDVVSLGGLAYGMGIFLAPLIYFFETSISLLVSMMLLVLAIILAVLLDLSISQKGKRKLEKVVKPEVLSKHILWIRPMSIKQIFTLLAAYIFILGFSALFFAAYIESRNVMLLLLGSFFLFIFLSTSRITVEEGHTTVKFKKEKVF